MEYRYKCGGCNELFNQRDIIKIHKGTSTAYRSFSIDYYCKKCYYEKHIFPYI